MQRYAFVLVCLACVGQVAQGKRLHLQDVDIAEEQAFDTAEAFAALLASQSTVAFNPSSAVLGIPTANRAFAFGNNDRVMTMSAKPKRGEPGYHRSKANKLFKAYFQTSEELAKKKDGDKEKKKSDDKEKKKSDDKPKAKESDKEKKKSDDKEKTTSDDKPKAKEGEKKKEKSDDKEKKKSDDKDKANKSDDAKKKSDDKGDFGEAKEKADLEKIAKEKAPSETKAKEAAKEKAKKEEKVKRGRISSAAKWMSSKLG